MKEKSRGKQNRTLVLQKDEIDVLNSQVLKASELAHAPESHSDTDEFPVRDRIINGDIMAVLPFLPDSFADLIIIDPPYNLTKNFNGLTFNARDAASYEEYVRSWLPAVCAKLKPTGSLYLCGDWKCTAALQRCLEEQLTVMNRITWQREKGRGAASNWKNSMEDIWFAVKNPDSYYFNVEAVKQKKRVVAPYRENGQAKDWEEGADGGRWRLTCPSNFWDDITVPFWSMAENTDHPTQKPEKLYAKLILASSRPGDVVFDPFLGSGTAAVVAKKLDRHFVGVELNEVYCRYGVKRLQMAEKDASIQGYADGVFWERNSQPRK